MQLPLIVNKCLNTEKIILLRYLFKWLFFAVLIGILAGSASALFLVSLRKVGIVFQEYSWLLFLLPLAGLLIGLLYEYAGKEVAKGNNLVIDEFNIPKKVIPFRMAPMILLGTLISHLFGASVGREGTAVQMGAAIADRFTALFRLKSRDRKVLLIMGISAGFASVFGTPIAGAVFALEVLALGQIRHEAILPSFLSALLAHFTCLAWGVSHSAYSISIVPDFIPLHIIYVILAGIIFGLTAMLFTNTQLFFSNAFKKWIPYSPMRPFWGGIIIVLFFLIPGALRYSGLGLDVITDSFRAEMLPQDFILKLLFTAFTLAAGFKGGEVTPLFFIGATLGNSLAWFIPLPYALLAGMGFVAVFSGATNTPLACMIMGFELFGMNAGIYIALACVTAYMFSGHTSIYSSQRIESPKHAKYLRLRNKKIIDIS